MCGTNYTYEAINKHRLPCQISLDLIRSEKFKREVLESRCVRLLLAVRCQFILRVIQADSQELKHGSARHEAVFDHRIREDAGLACLNRQNGANLDHGWVGRGGIAE